MWLERITGGGVDLIDLDDAKQHLRQLGDLNDPEIGGVIKAASAFLDVDDDGFGGIGFPIVNQRWALRTRRFEASKIKLPFTRITAIDEVRYFPADGGISSIIPDTDYMITGQGRLRFVTLMAGKSWPNLADREDAVDIRFTAGFATVDDVPDDIKAAARLLIGHFYENRLAVIEGQVSQEIKLGVDRLTQRYRRFAA